MSHIYKSSLKKKRIPDMQPEMHVKIRNPLLKQTHWKCSMRDNLKYLSKADIMEEFKETEPTPSTLVLSLSPNEGQVLRRHTALQWGKQVYPRREH